MISSVSLENWQGRFEAADFCPWPGPRPFRVGEGRHLLVGREADVERFRQEVASHRLIFLAGESGVGKTSLLRAGLVPELERSGFTVGICRKWGGGSMGDPATFVAQKLHPLFRARIERLAEGPDLFDELEEALGPRAVVILDQFEELIRDMPSFAEGVYELLLDLNRETNLKVVVSLRSEYLHKLRRVETEAGPFTFSRYILDEVAPEFARQIAEAPNREAVDAISPDAAKRVAKVWMDAKGSRSTTAQPASLLHLQALLYALHDKAGGKRVEQGTVESFLDELAGEQLSDPLHAPADVLDRALIESISVKLRRCEAASREIGLDPYLIEGTRRMIARAVPHLSSAGYKLVREAKELAEVTFGGDIESLTTGMRFAGSGDGEVDEMQYAALFDVLVESIPLGGDESEAEAIESEGVDVLGSDRAAIAITADARSETPAMPWLERLHPAAPPHVADPRDVTCGPMYGLAPANVLIEELRRFAFALAWLQSASLIRLSQPGSGGLMVTLIHDGFGGALTRWSFQPEMRGPGGDLHAITAPRGGSFPWQFDQDQGVDEPAWDVLDGRDETKVLANLRWRGAWVRATFRHVVFVNCDLRGTFFDTCTFTGVSFVNCLLDGVIFSDCRMPGSVVSAVDRAFPVGVDAPTFVVRPPREISHAIARYRDEPDGDVLLAQLPGLPAVPMAADAVDATPWTPEDGGVVIYGGQISTLVMRACRGTVALRHAAGSGLDVVESASGTFEFFDSKLRHLTVTPAVNQRDGVGHESGFDINARDCFLAQTWLGDGLSGTFDAERCILLQIWNGSAALQFTAKDSEFHRVVNVTLVDSRPMQPDEVGETLAEADSDQVVSRAATLMDYRRNPALTRVSPSGEPR